MPGYAGGLLQGVIDALSCVACMRDSFLTALLLSDRSSMSPSLGTTRPRRTTVKFCPTSCPVALPDELSCAAMVRRRPPALQLSKDTLDPCSPIVRRTPDSAQSWRSCRSQFSKVQRPPALNVDVQCPSRPTLARRSPDHEKAWEDDSPEGPSGGQ